MKEIAFVLFLFLAFMLTVLKLILMIKNYTRYHILDIERLYRKLSREESQKEVNNNYKWFNEHFDELVKQYDNKYILLSKMKVINVYDSFEQAFDSALDDHNFKSGEFSIQFCSSDPDKMIVKIHTPFMFL